MIGNGFVSLERIKTQEEMNDLGKRAADDSHGLFAPTLKVVKHGEIVGWVSIGQPFYPTCFGWLSTKKLMPRDGLTAWNMVETQAYLSGARGMIVPLPKESGFHPLMPQLGYKLAANYDFFIKEF
jgi:hypothetical protein